jgi:hypothetical protein
VYLFRYKQRNLCSYYHNLLLLSFVDLKTSFYLFVERLLAKVIIVRSMSFEKKRTTATSRYYHYHFYYSMRSLCLVVLAAVLLWKGSWIESVALVSSSDNIEDVNENDAATFSPYKIVSS